MNCRPRGAVTLVLWLLCVAGLGTRLQAQAISYEDFGAKGDGVADDLEAIAKAHAEANRTGLPVRARDAATYRIGGGKTTVRIETDTDFGKARFIIDDTQLEDHTAPVFEVRSKHAPVILDLKTLTKNQQRIEAKLPAGCVVQVTDRSIRRFIRRGNNQNDGSLQTDVFLVDVNGQVDPRTPILWDFPSINRAVAQPVDEQVLTLKGGHFTTIVNSTVSTSYHARGIDVQRSNVRFEGVAHHLTGEGKDGPPYRGFIYLSDCANVTIKDCIVSGRRFFYKEGKVSGNVPMGSYDISLNSALNVALINVTQANDIMDRTRWGVIGTNYCKNLLFDGCTLSRFDAHKGVTNATIRNTTIGHMGILLTGFGEFLVENSTVQSRHFIGLRPDYGSTWTGNITIRNCRFITQSGGVVLSGENDGQHDFGYPCQMPTRLIIDGLTIEDGKSAKNGPTLFDNFNPAFTSATQKFPYIVTREVTLKKVTTISGKPLRLSSNPAMFREVKVDGELEK